MRVWRLSVAYIGPKSRTERRRKTKIGIEVAHVTCDSDTTFKVKRSTCSGRRHIVAASRLLNYVNQAIAVYRRIVYHLFSSQLMEIRCIDSNCIRFYRCRQCWTIAKFGGVRARLPNNINVLILKPSPPSQSDSTCLSSVLWALSDQDKTAKLMQNYLFIMDARSAMRPCYILPMFF